MCVLWEADRESEIGRGYGRGAVIFPTHSSHDCHSQLLMSLTSLKGVTQL